MVGVPPRVAAGCTLGSVLFCRMKAAEPTARNSVEASGPASGNSETLRPTASADPDMYTSSSATDSKAKAVPSWGVPR